MKKRVRRGLSSLREKAVPDALVRRAAGSSRTVERPARPVAGPKRSARPSKPGAYRD